MATALPSTGSPQPGTSYSCDASDLFMIHRYFRGMFVDAQALVEKVVPGDPARVAILADHIAENIRYLHTHHRGEDELLWPKLESRTPSCIIHVEQMKVQHATVAGELDAVDGLLPKWRESASADDAATVASALAAVNKTFGAHLDQEELQIVPVAQVSVNQPEWDLLSEHGRKATPRDRAFIQLGYILAFMKSDDERAAFLKSLPAPARLLWRVTGRRRYEKDRAAVYG
jgi:hemerythrin-like domain-containing protein